MEKTCDELESDIKAFEVIKKEPKNFFADKFSKIINQVDVQRELA
jgi:hypothetical protein